MLVAVDASAALRRTVNRSCVRRYASCPNQRRANTPHCAVPLKVCWISLWCLETLQRTTQTQSPWHESLPLFPRSLPLRSSRRPFFSAVGQTVHCCSGSSGEADAVTGKMKKDHRLKCQNSFFFYCTFHEIGSFSVAICAILCATPMDTISSRWSLYITLCPVDATWAEIC